MAQTQVSLGLAGEILVAQALVARGYDASISHKMGDLIVYNERGDTLAVEVKTARRNKSGTYQFCMIKNWQGRVCCDHRKSDWTVFLCVLRTGNVIPFVVPSLIIGSRRGVAVTSYPLKYSGWLSGYRQSIDRIKL